MYAKKAGAPASKDKNMLKVENPYFDAKSKLPTNTTNLMPQQLQPRGKGGDKSVSMPVKGKGKGGDKGWNEKRWSKRGRIGEKGAAKGSWWKGYQGQCFRCGHIGHNAWNAAWL